MSSFGWYELVTPGYELYELGIKSTKIRKIKNKSFELSETLNIIGIDRIALENDGVEYS